jgi:hypothetical protein
MVLAAGAFVLWFVGREPEGWTALGGERRGWSVDVPPGWTAQVFSNDRLCGFLGYREALILTDGDFEFHGPRPGEHDECLGRSILAGFPRDDVAFAVQPYGRRIRVIHPLCLAPPIALADLDHGVKEGGPVNIRFSYAYPEGDDRVPTHVVRVWIGRDASQASRVLLERVLASLQFLRGPSDEP